MGMFDKVYFGTIPDTLGPCFTSCNKNIRLCEHFDYLVHNYI